MRVAAASLAAALVLAGCTGQGPGDEPSPIRIVTTDPAIAQALHDMGVRSVTSDPDLHSVLALHPELVLAGVGGRAWKDGLERRGIRVVTIRSTSLSDLYDDVEAIGRVVGARAAGERLARRMRRHAGLFERSVADLPQVTCFIEVGHRRSRIVAAGPGSLEYDVLRRAGCKPVTSHEDTPYPVWSIRQIVRADPNAYVATTGSVRSKEAVRQRAAFDALAAVRDGRVYVIGEGLLAPGPKIVSGLATLAKEIHPEAFG